eukprot:755494-Hanusia_phi.AAC.6
MQPNTLCHRSDAIRLYHWMSEANSTTMATTICAITLRLMRGTSQWLSDCKRFLPMERGWRATQKALCKTSAASCGGLGLYL